MTIVFTLQSTGKLRHWSWGTRVRSAFIGTAILTIGQPRITYQWQRTMNIVIKFMAI